MIARGGACSGSIRGHGRVTLRDSRGLGTLPVVIPHLLASSTEWPSLTPAARRALVQSASELSDDGRVTLLGAFDLELVVGLVRELERRPAVMDPSRTALRRMRAELTEQHPGLRVDFFAEDLREFEVAEETGCAVVPSLTFRALLTRTAQEQCLRCIASSLPADGALVLHVDLLPDGLAEGRFPATVQVEGAANLYLADHDVETARELVVSQGFDLEDEVELGDGGRLLVARRS